MGRNGLCGEERGHRLAGEPDPRRRCASATSAPDSPPRSCRALYLPRLPPLPNSSALSDPPPLSLLTSPTPPPRSHASHPGPRAGRRVVSPPLPTPRLPLPEGCLHRRVPARPQGDPLHCRRQRGRHATHEVRQLRPESEGGAAGVVDGAAGARVLGSEHAGRQGHRTNSRSEPEHPAPLLQPERGR